MGRLRWRAGPYRVVILRARVPSDDRTADGKPRPVVGAEAAPGIPLIFVAILRVG